MPDQKPIWTRCVDGFSVMWVTKLLISPVKKRIFCPKTTKFGPKLAFLFIAGSFGAQLVGLLVVMVRAVSRKTPIYFISLVQLHFWSEKITFHSLVGSPSRDSLYRGFVQLSWKWPRATFSPSSGLFWKKPLFEGVIGFWKGAHPCTSSWEPRR